MKDYKIYPSQNGWIVRVTPAQVKLCGRGLTLKQILLEMHQGHIRLSMTYFLLCAQEPCLMAFGVTRYGTRVGRVCGKCLNPCAISLNLGYFFLGKKFREYIQQLRLSGLSLYVDSSFYKTPFPNYFSRTHSFSLFIGRTQSLLTGLMEHML